MDTRLLLLTGLALSAAVWGIALATNYDASNNWLLGEWTGTASPALPVADSGTSDLGTWRSEAGDFNRYDIETSFTRNLVGAIRGRIVVKYGEYHTNPLRVETRTVGEYRTTDVRMRKGKYLPASPSGVLRDLSCSIRKAIVVPGLATTSIEDFEMTLSREVTASGDQLIGEGSVTRTWKGALADALRKSGDWPAEDHFYDVLLVRSE